MIKKINYILLLCLTVLLLFTAGCSGSGDTQVSNSDTVKRVNTASPVAVPPAAGGCCE